MYASATLIGEAFVGGGAEAAHVNLVIGRRGGPVEVAWVTALATPRSGHVPFMAVLRPGLPVRPFTLFVNKAPIEGERHATLTWGAAQAGVAAGLAEALAAGDIPAADAADLLCVAAVWVDPAAAGEEEVFVNNRAATLAAVRAAVAQEPSAEAVIAAASEPANPFFRREGT
jgi:5,6,7,8-tetrahydromethanopterin hydro-lyase